MNITAFYNNERQKMLDLIKPLKVGMVIKRKYQFIDLMVSLSEKHTLTFRNPEGICIKLVIDRRDTYYNYKYGGYTRFYSYYLDNSFISTEWEFEYREFLTYIKFLLIKNEKNSEILDFSRKELLNIFEVVENDQRNNGMKFIKFSKRLVESIQDFKYKEERIKYIFDLNSIGRSLDRNPIENIKANKCLVIFNSEVEFYERYFFQFFNFFFPKDSVDLLFLKSSPISRYPNKIDQTKIITRIKNKYKYNYIFSVGTSALFDNLLKNSKIRANFVLFNIGVSPEVWERKMESPIKFYNLKKAKRHLDVYSFEADWPKPPDVIKKYYRPFALKIQSYPLLPLMNLIRANKDRKFLFDIAFIGESILNFKFSGNLKKKKIIILTGSLYKNLQLFRDYYIKHEKNKNISIMPNISLELFERIVSISRVIILPPVIPSKTSNTCIALGKCLIVNNNLFSPVKNVYKNIIFVKRGSNGLIEKYLENYMLNLKMSEKNIDFAVKHFDLTKFFCQIMNKYF
ncbi:MAG: hypothetical protein NT116_04420 [Candidatus Parcubacteria bacterium]|nr:hypothetical protein [Candidatus Parcubacteria bacterium]